MLQSYPWLIVAIRLALWLLATLLVAWAAYRTGYARGYRAGVAGVRRALRVATVRMAARAQQMHDATAGLANPASALGTALRNLGDAITGTAKPTDPNLRSFHERNGR